MANSVGACQIPVWVCTACLDLPSQYSEEFLWSLHRLVPEMQIAEFANSVDLDEVAHNELSHLDLHCLPSSL